MDKIRYLHESMKPLLPAVGDIRVLPTLKYSFATPGKNEKPVGKIHVVRCVEIKEHHAVYEYLDEDRLEAIPFEMIDTWGMLNIDAAVKWILNAFMSDLIETSKKSNSIDAMSISSEMSEYFNRLKDLVVLSREVLKEAERARKTLIAASNKGA